MTGLRCAAAVGCFERSLCADRMTAASSKHRVQDGRTVDENEQRSSYSGCRSRCRDPVHAGVLAWLRELQQLARSAAKLDEAGASSAAVVVAVAAVGWTALRWGLMYAREVR